jgi:phage shock protein PspC (stress-responsive transcriptional regulator)
MKKIININLSGRLIPIEDTAYDMLQLYIESLNRYFANEEGRGEIMSDIESRIAELFQDKIKKGAHCITDADVESVMVSIGRPEDFDDQEEQPASTGNQQTEEGAAAKTYTEGRRRFSRNGNDKILGGVCSGLANFLNIDPAIVRILFALFVFVGGFGILLYILLWIFIPEENLKDNIRKRLYRNPDDKVIGGVCGGISAYFNIDRWIPRLIFASPFIISILVGILRQSTWGWDPFPFAISSTFGGTLFVAYIILWIVLPVANSSYEKMEMRGEKVDLNSIKNTVRQEMEGFKKRAEKWGDEMKTSAKTAASEMSEKAQAFGSEIKQFSETKIAPAASDAAQAIRSRSTGLGHAIGVLFKAFFLFIAGCIVFAAIFGLISLFSTSTAWMPLKQYALSSNWQYVLAWGTLLFFVCVPLIAFITWAIRRIAGMRSRNNYLGYIFGGLWTLGIVSLVLFIASISKDFREHRWTRDPLAIEQPANGKLVIMTDNYLPRKGGGWLNYDDDNNLRGLSISEDSLLINNVRVKVVKSNDDRYHAELVRSSSGRTGAMADNYASNIRFNVKQSNDSTLMLDRGFAIYKGAQFRNQGILLIIEVPVGKKIRFDKSINRYSWTRVSVNRNRDFDIEFDDYNYHYNGHWHDNWMTNEDFIMTADGTLESVNKRDRNNNRNNNGNDSDNNNDRYRYPGNNNNDNNKPKSDTVAPRDSQPRNQPAANKAETKADSKEAVQTENNATARGNGSYNHPNDVLFELLP